MSDLPMPENPGGLVYGTILVATLLAAEQSGHESYGKSVGSVGLALLVYWLAIAYSEYTGHRASDAGHFTLSGFLRVAVHEASVLLGALGPLVALLICWAIGARLSTAIAAAAWTAAGIIVATEVALGLRSHLDGHDLVIQTAVGVALGLLVVALRVLLH